MPEDALLPHSQLAATLLKSLANPYRLQILCALSRGELNVAALNQQVPLSQSALSQHLAKLHKEGLVTRRKVSQAVFYQPAPGPSLDIIQVLHTHFCFISGD